MSAFCVFGMTEALAKSLAAKKPPKRDMSPKEYEDYLADKAEEIFEKAARRQLSPLYDAPQFCEDWIAVANRTIRAASLKIMVRDVKVDKKGQPVISKRTKQPLMTWRPYA